MQKKTRVPKPISAPILRKGSLVTVDNLAARVVAICGHDRIQLEVLGTRETRWTRLEELCPLPEGLPNAAATVEHPEEADPHKEERAAEWVRCLAALLADPTKDHKHRVAQQMQRSIRVVNRRLEQFRIDPSVSGQLDDPPGPPPGQGRVGQAREAIVERAIDAVFATPQKAPMTAAHLEANRMCVSAGLTPVSYKVIQSRIRARALLPLTVKRLGHHEAKALRAPATGGLNATHALSDVQIDHALMDIVVVSAKDRQPIGRPWITIAIDVATRCVLGYYLGLETPNQTSVALCLEHAIFPKGEWLKRLDLHTPYPMCGKLGRIHWDNAKTFQSLALKTHCERYGITTVPRPARQPHYGAYIERYIGTLMRAVHLLPGTTFSNPRVRGDYDSEKRAVMTMAELERWLAEQIAGVYHHQAHRGLGGITPSEAWKRAWTDSDGSVGLPPLISDRREFVTGLLPSVTRRVQRNGVCLFGLTYWDAALAPYIKNGKGYRVHFHQRDMSRVMLCADGHYFDVPLLDRTQPPFALWELRDARRVTKQAHCKDQSQREVLKALASLREQEDGAVDRSKLARRAQAKRPRGPVAIPPATTPDYSLQPQVLRPDLGEVQ